jgi:hypothetical protein
MMGSFIAFRCTSDPASEYFIRPTENLRFHGSSTNPEQKPFR